MKTRICSEHSYGDKQVKVYDTEMPNQEARFAFEMLGRFGLIAGMPDGEDSTGRQKAALLPVEETVARVFDLAHEAFRVARERGLMVALPDLNEINAEADAERAAKDEKKREKATA
jgi:hypothetical protein